MQALGQMQAQNQEFLREMAAASAAASLASSQAATAQQTLLSTQMTDFMAETVKELGANRKTTHDENINKPFVFDGAESKYSEWMTKILAYIRSKYKGCDEALKWAMGHDTAICSMTYSTTQFKGIQTEMDDWAVKIQNVLSGNTGDKAFKIVQAGASGGGFETLRLLRNRYDPASPGTKRALLKALMNVKACQKINEVEPAIMKLEEGIKKYSDMAAQPMPDDLIAVLLVDVTFGDLKKHLELTTSDMDPEMVRKEIIKYCNRLRNVVNDQFVEMEIENVDQQGHHDVQHLGWNCHEGEYYSPDYYAGDWWPEEELNYFGGKGGNKGSGGKGFGSGGKGFGSGGKGYGKSFQFDPKGKGKTGKSYEKGWAGDGGYKGGKGFGKEGKGGKGFGKGGFQGDCFWCGKFGHSQRNCPDKDAYYNYLREGKTREANSVDDKCEAPLKSLEKSGRVFQLSSLVSVNRWESLYSEPVDIEETQITIHPPGLTPIQASVKVAEKKKMPKMPQVRSWKQKQTVASSKYCCGSSDPGCAATWHSLHADGFKSSGMCGKKDEEVEMNSFEEMIELYNVEYDGWIEGVDGIDYLEFTVDSGAADTVGNDGMAPDYPVVPSEGSINGVKYIAAAGQTIPNEGE